MNVLVIGSGAREHALAWALGKDARVVCAPGNGGTGPNLALSHEDVAAYARGRRIGLVVVGPEGPLAEGLVDRLQAEGVAVFGPTRAAARLESSKAWAKDFMRRHQIPTALSQTVTSMAEAERVLKTWSGPLVVKASGLAAGKGVTLHPGPDDARGRVRDLLIDKILGVAGEEVLLEDHLEGQEISLLTLVSGEHWKPLPLACDYKRLSDGDRGPNTGGMGAYCPAAAPDYLLTQLADEVMQPIMRGLRADGLDYRGLLYVGVMLTASGPKVLEFNVRFGDPETQVILPLLDGSWLEVLQSVVEGRLHEIDLRWQTGTACGVVVAATSYPTSGTSGVPLPPLTPADDILVFHAATLKTDHGLVSHGGRILTVVATRPTLQEARNSVYHWLDNHDFKRFHYRRDIGQGERLDPARELDPPEPVEVAGASTQERLAKEA